MDSLQLFSIRSIKNIGIFFICSTFSKGFSLLLTPFLLYHLSPSQIGLLSLFNSFIALFSILLSGGLRSVLWLNFFHLNLYQQRQQICSIVNVYISYALPLTIVSIFLWSAIIFVIKDYASVNLLDIYIAGLESCYICFTLFFFELLIQLETYQQRPQTILFLYFLNCLGSLLGIFIMLTAKPAISIALSGQLFGISITIAAGYYCDLWGYFDQLKFCSWSCIKASLRQSFIFIPSVIAGWILGSSSRWILAYYISLDEAALYSIVELCSTAFYACILQPIGNGYLPVLLSNFSNSYSSIAASDNKNHKIMILCMITVGILGLLLYTVAQAYLVYLLPEFYRKALPYCLISFVGNIALLGTYFTTALPHFYKKSYFLVSSIVATSFVSVYLNLLLVPRYRLLGSCIALLIAHTLYFVATVAYNRHLHGSFIFEQIQPQS
ncbi:MAG TPA: hypothetical protein VHA52_09115 [Candidatus Babeliaceae bacterium]|nr:hypothetical protein [Candidatus Babeliaceae bacterium]